MKRTLLALLTTAVLAGTALLVAAAPASACSGPQPVVGRNANCMARNDVDRHLNCPPVDQVGCTLQDAGDAGAYVRCYPFEEPVNWTRACA